MHKPLQYQEHGEEQKLRPSSNLGKTLTSKRAISLHPIQIPRENYLDQNIKVHNYLNKTSHNQRRDVYFKKEQATCFLKIKQM